MKLKKIYAGVLSLFISLTSCGQTAVTMQSASMEPTIKSGDKISALPIDSVRKDDIVVFNYLDPNSGKNLKWVSRVIACPGDLFEIKAGIVFINSKASESGGVFIESFREKGQYEADILGSSEANRWNRDHLGPIRIPKKGEVCEPSEETKLKLTRFLDKNRRVVEDLYFVMGDNRHNSYDSRYIGYISRSSISAQVRL